MFVSSINFTTNNQKIHFEGQWLDVSKTIKREPDASFLGKRLRNWYHSISPGDQRAFTISNLYHTTYGIGINRKPYPKLDIHLMSTEDKNLDRMWGNLEHWQQHYLNEFFNMVSEIVQNAAK